MSFNTAVNYENDVATIKLTGELDSRSAPQFNEVIAGVADHKVSRLVLLCSELTYMSSAGLRGLVFAHQKMGRGVAIVVVGAQPAVAETITLTGFDRSVIMQDAAESR